MKIENNPLNRIPNQGPVEPLHTEGKAAPTGASKEKYKAELSDQARIMAKAYQTVRETPDTRSERVSELKQRVNDGNYTVSVKKLARNLLPVVSGQKD